MKNALPKNVSSSGNKSLLPVVLFVWCLAFAASAAEPNAPVNVADYKPPIRVACLGDSITHGVGAGPGWAWPDQLQRMLGEAWDVRNFGHSGASVAKEEKHTIWSQKEYANALLFHPDVAIILLGTNDTKPDNWKSKDKFPKLYQELVFSFTQLSSKPRVFCGTAPYVAKKGAFGINEAGVLEQMPMIKKVASDAHAGVIDVHAATAGHDEWYKDNVHPSTEGATAIAAAVYRALTGKDWVGAVPALSRNAAAKPVVRIVANPGELSLREVFTLLSTETNISREALQPLREKFEAMTPQVDAKIQELENRITESETLRMKYKHSTVEDEKSLYSEYRSKGSAAVKELGRCKLEANAELIAMIPPETKAEFGAAALARYVTDRLTPIGTTLSAEQRKKIHEVCKPHGVEYAKINNTPERSILDAAVYKEVYARMLDAEQKKRVEPQ